MGDYLIFSVLICWSEDAFGVKGTPSLIFTSPVYCTVILGLVAWPEGLM